MTRLLTLFLLLSAPTLLAQTTITHAQYLAHIDSLQEARIKAIQTYNQEVPPHNREANDLEWKAEKHPESKDSLLALAAAHRQTAKEKAPALEAEISRIAEERKAFEKQYELVFEEAFPYFRRRRDFSKDSLSAILKSASPEIRKSPTGKALRKYIASRQIAEGESFRHFNCFDSQGKRFNWKAVKGKKVFLIHDGLWCMTHGMDNTRLRKYLEKITSIAPDCFPLIVVNCHTPEELQASIDEYGLRAFCVVSELSGTLGKLNWISNDTVTPTCHYIDENGILLHSSEGIDTRYLEQEFLKIR